jgi:beta-galactosidase beta subunit
MFAFVATHNSLSLLCSVQEKRKYADISSANFPRETDDDDDEISLPYCIDQSKISRSIQAGNFVVAFKKPEHSENRKLIMNENDNSEDED